MAVAKRQETFCSGAGSGRRQPDPAPVAGLEVVTNDESAATTVEGLIAREHKQGRRELLWLALTAAAVAVVILVALPMLWPPPALQDVTSGGMPAE